MQSQEMRLRHKWSHMPCNLVNFISVNWESEVGWGLQRGGKETKKKKEVKSEKPQRVRKRSVGGGGISHHHHGFDDVQQCQVGSGSVQAWRPRRGRSPAARQ